MNLRKRMVRMPGKLKGFFCVFRLDRFIPIYLFHFFANLAELSIWISKHKNDCSNDFYIRKFNSSKRETLYEQVITTCELDTHINYIEFGVSKGASFRWWVDRIQHADARFYGFDTFSGLPEAWGPFKKGDMGNDNEPPVIDDYRHTFYQGLFQQTLIPFLNSYKSDCRKVIHMDADIYSATLYVLTLITPYLEKGDIIFFDEFSVPLHEFKVLKEWSSSFYINYKVLGGVNNFYQIAIMIE